MPTTTRILALASTTAARSAQLLAAVGAQVHTVGDRAQLGAALAADPGQLLLVDGAGIDDPAAALLREAIAGGADLLLAVDGPAGPQDYERMLAVGGIGVVARDATASAVAELLARVEARRSAARRAHEDAARCRVQLDELRRRCKVQADRFQETQQTFFLDLSRMMTIITNIMDGIVFVDRGGNVTLMNPVAEDLLGVKSFVAIGKALPALQGQRELLQTLVTDHARLASRKEAVSTIEVHHGEQDLLYIKCMTSLVHDFRGQPAGTLTVLRDVTAEYKTDQLKNQYLSIVAHELRTPLTGIKTFATMMAKGTLGALSDAQQRVCESIREQSVRLEHQIDKLINLGNLESADYGQDREAIAVDDFVAGLLLPFEQPARDRRIALTFQSEHTDELLFADRADLRRACQALIENAVKFTPDGGRVDVSIRNQGGGLCLHVVDNGIGVDPRYQRRIFEKFFQVEDPLTRHHGGAGLGLFVARGIVEAHGSRIEVSSRLGAGADFSFMLPLYRQLEHAGPVAGAATK